MRLLRKNWNVVFCMMMLLGPSVLFGKGGQMDFHDADHVRYQLYQTNGGKPYNWLFFPGGPGADSCYFKGLIDHLKLPGNVWLVDLPGNGSNLVEGPLNFDRWIEIFPGLVRKFENPILVGHSFGGMFPLLFPELETDVKGFVILNAAPSLWLEEAVAYSKQFDLPDLSHEMHEFTERPSQETFEKALDACMPYYFPKATLEKGRKMLSQVPFQYLPAVWWQRKVMELNFSAKWVPLKVPTLIVGAKFDCICPVALFQKDERFQRPNIEFLNVDNGGHLPWIENLATVQEGFHRLIERLEDKEIPKASFAVIYRGYVKPGRESDYLEHWKTVANYFVKERGALGSTLHKTEEGMWIAYSRWPNKESRDASWPADGEETNSTCPISIHETIRALKSCLDVEQQLPEIIMSVVEEAFFSNK